MVLNVAKPLAGSFGTANSATLPINWRDEPLHSALESWDNSNNEAVTVSRDLSGKAYMSVIDA